MSSQNSDTQELDKKKAQLNPDSDSTNDTFKNIVNTLKLSIVYLK